MISLALCTDFLDLWNIGIAQEYWTNQQFSQPSHFHKDSTSPFLCWVSNVFSLCAHTGLIFRVEVWGCNSLINFWDVFKFLNSSWLLSSTLFGDLISEHKKFRKEKQKSNPVDRESHNRLLNMRWSAHCTPDDYFRKSSQFKMKILQTFSCYCEFFAHHWRAQNSDCQV
jgi:hypothetical protein